MDIRELFDELKNEHHDAIAKTLWDILRAMDDDRRMDVRQGVKWFVFDLWEDATNAEDELASANSGYADRVKEYSLAPKGNEQALLHLQDARRRYKDAQVEHAQAERFYNILRKVYISLL